MSDFSIYILSIAGVTVLIVLIELVLPSGNLSKFIKVIMSVVIVFVMINPIASFFKNGFKFDFSSSEISSQSVFDTIKQQQISQTKQNLEHGLAKKGFEGVKLDIIADFENGTLKISSIFVDLSNLVLTQENQHILYTEAVENFLLEQTGLKAGQVIIYD